MKRFTKKAFVFFGIFFVLGMVFCTAGWVMGYQPGQVLEEYRTDWSEEGHEQGALAQAAEYQNVSAIEISAGASICEISAYSGDTVRIEVSDKTLLACEQDGGHLEISYGARHHSFWKWITGGSRGPETIRIFVPGKEPLAELYADVGASEFIAEGITCKELELTCGAGKLSFTGEVTGNCFAECGAGAVELSLKGTEKDYDYSLECGLGTIEVQDGPDISGVGEYTKDNQSGRRIELECGLGSITVEFRKI
ncbi:MAG: hypothetical protein Q4E91_06540 [Lachnospiraceae bacterium]|nr:hypothetical protein [Lachnospiraceae bacterium]